MGAAIQDAAKLGRHGKDATKASACNGNVCRLRPVPADRDPFGDAGTPAPSTGALGAGSSSFRSRDLSSIR